MADTTTDNGKTAAIVSYITIIGWLISFFALNKPKTSFGSYHLRQSLLVHIFSLVLQVINWILVFTFPTLSLIVSLLGIGVLVFLILGIINAVNMEEKPLPLIGEKAEELFKNI
jgi:uncharacterized membrane protein